jgi:hypothetical protein
MPKPIYDMSTWDATAHAALSQVPVDAWQATRAQTGLATRLIDDREAELEDGSGEIGRRIDARTCELFVSCEPAQALQQQLEHLQPDYIAIHDVGTASSRRMVVGLAAASGRGVQRLVIRRQGLGITLATIEYAWVPAAGGAWLRVFSTEIDADTQSRRDLARILLAHSRLGVVMVGDLPTHALESALRPLGDAMLEGPWINTGLIMLPLASASVLAGAAAQLGRRTRIEVRSTPQVTRPSDAWAFVAGTWNRVRSGPAGVGRNLPAFDLTPSAPGAAAAAAGPAPTSPSAASAAAALHASRAAESGTLTSTRPTASAPAGTRPAMDAVAAKPWAAPLAMQPMPPIPSSAPRGGTSAAPLRAPDPAGSLQHYVETVARLDGVVSACAFEVSSQRSLAHAGGRPGPAMLASQGAAVLEALADAARKLGLAAHLPEAAVTLAGHHLVLHPVSRHPGVVLHAVIDKARVNLTTARLQIQRVDLDIDRA